MPRQGKAAAGQASPPLLFVKLRQVEVLSPPLRAEQAGAVAGVVVLQHGGRVPPGVPGAGRVPHSGPALPARRDGLPCQRLVA